MRPKTFIQRGARQARRIVLEQQNYRKRALIIAGQKIQDLNDEWMLANLDQRLGIVNALVKLWDTQRILCGEALPRDRGQKPLIEMPRPHIQLAQFTDAPTLKPSPDGLFVDSYHDAGSASSAVSTAKDDVQCLSEREGTSDFEIPPPSVLL